MWYKIKNEQVEIHIFAKPNAKKSALVKITDDGLNIALHAKPHDGEANKELTAFIAKFFQIPKSSVKLLRGTSSRYKTIEIPLTDAVRLFLETSEKNTQ